MGGQLKTTASAFTDQTGMCWKQRHNTLLFSCSDQPLPSQRSGTSALRKDKDLDTCMRKTEQSHRGKKWVRVLHLGDLGG